MSLCFFFFFFMVFPMFSKQTNTQIFFFSFFSHHRTQSPLFFNLIPTIQHLYLFKNPLPYASNVVILATTSTTITELSPSTLTSSNLQSSRDLQHIKNNGHHPLICRARPDLEPRGADLYEFDDFWIWI